jgi:hypothetical protein
MGSWAFELSEGLNPKSASRLLARRKAWVPDWKLASRGSQPERSDVPSERSEAGSQLATRSSQLAAYANIISPLKPKSVFGNFILILDIVAAT